MRDGRVVYVGNELIDDVTDHSAFCEGAKTIARLYDVKADPAKRDLFSYREDGEDFSIYWQLCRSREDLARRTRALKAIADETYGLIGRSSDHVPGLANPDVLERLRAGCKNNLIRYWERARREDLYLCLAVVPPTGQRDRDIFLGQERDDPVLRVVDEDADGVIITGMKMLETGGVYADEVWIGNLTPIDDKFKAESITAALPLNAPGVSLWARRDTGSRLPTKLPLR